MAWLVIFLLCLGHIAAQFLGNSFKSENQIDDGLLHLLLKLRQEEFYDTLLVYGEDCVFHSVIRHLDVPTVLVSSGSTSYDWNFSSLTMILGCGPNAEQEATNRTLIKLQRNRRLIYLQENIQPENVCNNYAEKEQFNIAMVKDDFNESQIIYTCRYFQDPNFEEISLSEKKPIYIEQFRNMHGNSIRTVPDLLPPRCMQYWDSKTGEMKTIGYVSNLINNFAQRVNATLKFGFLAPQTNIRKISDMAQRDELDIGMTLESSLYSKNFETSSYPYLMTSYCVMAKVPTKIPFNLVYAVIVEPLVLVIIFVMFCLISILIIFNQNMSWRELKLSNILLNDMSLRGLLGQSFPFPSNASKQLRLIFTILCFASIMLTTMYEAYLQSFFTDPPSEPRIRSFKDFGEYNQKLAVTDIEAEVLRSTNNTQFMEMKKDSIEIFKKWRECVSLRDSFNTSYNYIVTDDRWSSIAEQQKLFKEPLFYYSRDLCFSQLFYFSIPLRRHLPYRHLFEDHLMRQNEFGLVNYWKSRSFFEMVRLGITPLKDLSKPKAFDESIILEDISLILKLYLAAICVSIFCFLSEVLGEKWRHWRS
ncbi:uncharacterized protein LOC108112077 [Drosophila eugracilis]|uniref:uncharacterized protein LOC108112077 n=1 Tax=Drosophila eugracilis TaxID=29029 RepID=UPI0007E63759|nr:uncharacterized protein LOC108112077 [Drosophila eugracilis]